MQPNSNVRSLDDSLYAGSRALGDAAEVVAQIRAILCGPEPEMRENVSGDVSNLMSVADVNTQRIVSLVTELQSIREPISAPKVEQMAGYQVADQSLRHQMEQAQIQARLHARLETENPRNYDRSK